MAWAAEDVTLGQASPPNLFIVATSADVDSWSEETFPIPISLEQSINRRRLLYMVMRAITSPATAQVDKDKAIPYYSYTFVTRNGMIVSPHVLSRIGMTALPAQDGETLPLCEWHNPFNFPLRGADRLTTLVPGDADATPVQDWHLEMLFGPELKR